MKKSILTTAFALAILFANAQLKVLSSNGFVGIGTSPVTLLHTKSIANTDNEMMIDVTYGYNKSIIGFANGGTDFGRLYFDNSTNNVVLYQMFSSGDLLMGTNSATNLIIKNGGNVGIGTTGPKAKLSIGNNVATGFLDTYSEYQEILYDGTTAPLSYGFGIKANTMVFNSGTGAYSFDRGSAATSMVLDNSGKVGIGTTSPSSVLSVGGAGATTLEAYIYNPTQNGSYGGLKSESITPGAGNNSYGIIGNVVPGAGNTYGVQGSSFNTSTSTGQAVGVYGYATNGGAGITYGVYGSISTSTSNGAGVFGSTGGNVNTGAKYAIYSNGDFYVNSSVTIKTGNIVWTNPSDKRLKKNIASFTDGLNVIRKINTVTYQYTGAGGILDTISNNIGVLAQDVQPIAPYCVGQTKMVMKQSEASAFGNDIVSTYQDSGGTKAVVNALSFNANGLIFAMLNSIKQLDSTVTALQKQVANCCSKGTTQKTNEGDGQGTINIHELELANNTVLYQNYPNPFGDGTTIKYFISDNISNAQIIFFDEFGNKLKELKVEEKGMGQLDIASENLANGVYSYSLIVNGRAVDTKKMVRVK